MFANIDYKVYNDETIYHISYVVFKMRYYGPN